MFELPEKIRRDIEDYRKYLNDFLDTRMNSARFTGIRVPWGIYSHRGGKVFMSRIRIPAGWVGPSQLKAIGQVAQKYGNGVAHITTRQDIQVHEVKIEDTIKVIDYLKEYHLSSRGGGGNTVRNITSCPLSGICPEEIFDVKNDAISLSEYLLCQNTSYNLPRKFKIAFSGCAKDCAGCLANDLGFLAQYQKNKRGFKVFVGGGMGAEPRLGELLEEFISEEDLGYCVEATKNVFNRYGDRKNKHHNRLRFLIENIGMAEFKGLYDRELQKLKENDYIALRKVAPGKEIDQIDGEIPSIDDEEFKAFVKYNIRPQKQKGFVSVELRIPRGDITAKELSDLADLEKDFEGIQFRTSSKQNILICWLRQQDLYRLFLRLKGILKDFIYPQTLLDVVTCKGALTCNLGLCNSPGLSKEIEKMITSEFIGTDVFRDLEIKINGCPNACGQHPLGRLSFYGIVKRVDQRPVPFYKFLLGGRREAERTQFAQEIGIIPAKNVPDFLRLFLKRIEEIIHDKEVVNGIDDLLRNQAREIAIAVIKDFSYVPTYYENRDFYIDWGKTKEFSLEGLGPGECGAGVVNMIESDLKEAQVALEEAERENYSAEKIRKAIFFSSRSLLVVKGQDPKNAEEALSSFKSKFVEEGIASDIYANIDDIFKNINDELSQEEKEKKFLYAKEFLSHMSQLYREMDPSFNFPKKREKVKEPMAHHLDLRGTPCPLNYVKAKLFLEDLNSGEVLKIFLDEGESINNVPQSLKNDGHEIIIIEKQDGFYQVVVKKSG